MLWLPREVEEARLQADATAARLVDHETHRQLATVKRFNRELKDIDPHLELVWVSRPRDFDGDAPLGIVWNRWHVLRHVPGQAPDFLAITGADGSYAEPTSRIFDRLREMDMWRDDVRARERKRKAREAADRERAKDSEREEIREEIAWKLKALENPGINFGHRGWTAKAGKASK